ncbi:MAG: alkyl hydroperoxide reductase [Acidobacteria bacterium]|nr:alkyl hydroperoxide reductase [Acidobacteriota bacterium]
MNLEQLLDTVPNFAKDLKLNLGNLLQQPELTKQQTWGTALTSAITARNPVLLKAIEEKALEHLKPEAAEAARSAAAIMGMNNVYYRFLHLTKNEKYATIPARLRMNAIRSHGIEALDFELFCIAASAINGCGACVDSHEKVVREKGADESIVLACVRIASVVQALATVLPAA